MTGTTEHRERSKFDSARYLATLMAEFDRAEISTRIRHARKQAGFRNRQEFADLLHVHWRTIEDWENPKHANVPWDRLDEIAMATDVTRDWLLHGEREESVASAELIESRLESLEAKVDEANQLTLRALGLLELLAAPPVAAAPPTRKRANV